MTYSIVARDPVSGELGVAVQSHWFSVGSIVTWAAAGVGAVATQANAEPAYGPRALELMRAGVGARDSLARLLAEDPLRASRQVAVMDARGQMAVHTGGECMPHAGHVIGLEACCQANIMRSKEVWPSMLRAFQGAVGQPLADRLLVALEAGEAAGGDLRGRQSAALLVVPAQGPAWQASVSLRVEDHPEPLIELRRLLGLQRAYRLAGEADELVGEGRHDEAAGVYGQASQLAPDNLELRFWAGLGAAEAGDLSRAVSELQAVVAVDPSWRELLARLPRQVAPSAAAVLSRLPGKGP